MNKGKGVRSVMQEYFSVKDLATYSGISERTLRDLLKDPVNPIPSYRLGPAGKIIRVRRSEFDGWVEKQLSVQDARIDQIVDELLDDRKRELAPGKGKIDGDKVGAGV